MKCVTKRIDRLLVAAGFFLLLALVLFSLARREAHMSQRGDWLLEADAAAQSADFEAARKLYLYGNEIDRAAECCIYLKDEKKLRELCSKIRETEPWKAHLFLGSLQERLGNLEAARDEYEAGGDNPVCSRALRNVQEQLVKKKEAK